MCIYSIYIFLLIPESSAGTREDCKLTFDSNKCRRQLSLHSKSKF